MRTDNIVMDSCDYRIDDTESEDDYLDDEGVPWWCSSRLYLAILMFFGLMSISSQRVCLEVAIPCMINFTKVDRETFGALTANRTRAPGDVDEGCGPRPWLFPENLNLEFDQVGDLDWSVEKQKVIFEAYFWGYLFSNIPLGYLATRFGGRLVMGISVALSSVSTMMIPLTAELHYFIIIALRFLAGAGAGVTFPALHTVWGKWAPPKDRSKLIAGSYAGFMVGNVSTFPLSAALCRYGPLGGWKTIFYTLGGSGVLWSILWVLCIRDNPTKHPTISRREQEYIVESLKHQVDFSNRQQPIAWNSFLTSIAYMSLIVCHFTTEWGMYTFQIQIPDYMHQILQFDIATDPILSGLPYVVIFITAFFSGIWADKLINRAFVPATIVRKIMQGVGTIIPAAMMVGMGFLECNHAAPAISMLVIGQAFCGFQYSGHVVNHLDIAPRYAGIMMGVASTIGGLAYVLAPIIFRKILTEHSKEEWQTMYFTGAALYIFGYIIFLICGSGDLQSWAKHRNPKNLDALISTTSSDSQKSKEKPLLHKQPSSQKKKDLAQGLEIQKQLILLSQLPTKGNRKTISRLSEAVGHIIIPLQGAQPQNKPTKHNYRSQSLKVPKAPARSLEEIHKPNHRRTSSVKSDSSKYVIRPIGDQSPARYSGVSVKSADSISDNEAPQLRRPSSESTNFFDTLEESVL